MFFFGKSYEYQGKRARIAPIMFQVLSILQEKGSLTGYAITKELNSRFQDLWKASFGTVVPLLKRLEDDGLVTKESISVGNRIGQSYSITEKGICALQPTPSESKKELNLLTKYIQRILSTKRDFLYSLADFIEQMIEKYETDAIKASSSLEDEEIVEQIHQLTEKIQHKNRSFDPDDHD